MPKGVSREQADARLGLLDFLEDDFAAGHPGISTSSHQTAYEKAVRIMRSESAQAFDLEDEPAKLRDSYGRNPFGQACLLARRLVQRGVPFIEVSLNGWDTHRDNFNSVQRLCETLDPAWATLMKDLRTQGLLDSTLIIWMDEFGRTPKINRANGRDHFPTAWTTVLAGGGVQGGQILGETSDDGMRVTDRPVSVGDFVATVCKALGVDPMKQNMSNVGRPIRLADPDSRALDGILL